MDPIQADQPGRHPGYLDSSVRSFLAKLSDPTPEPAGGAALALATAMAAALAELVAAGDRLSADACDDPTLSIAGTTLTGLRDTASRLVDEDVAAYGEVMRALDLPTVTAEQQARRRKVLDAALEGAATVPLSVAEVALDILGLTAGREPEPRSPLRGDLAAARWLALGAAQGALATALVNIEGVRSAEVVAPLGARYQVATERLALYSAGSTGTATGDATGGPA